MTDAAYVPDAGDLIWVDFNPTLGHEQAGRRPALVVSPAAFSNSTGFALVCPVTSKVRPFPSSAVLPDGLPVAGEILLSHMRSVDFRARQVRYICVAPPEVAREVRLKLARLITI